MDHDEGELSQALAVIVDDDPAIRILARRTLENAGFTVEEAADGDEGLETILRTRPEIVLLDVMMPGRDGFSVCEALRDDPEVSGIPVMMMTGLDDHASIDRSYEAGATDFVVKPVNWLVLPRRARFILRASRAFESVRRSEAGLALAQRIARLGNWEWDAATGRVRCSDEVLRILGADEGEVDLGYEDFCAFIDRAQRDEVLDERRRVLAEGGSYEIHYRLLPRGGSESFVHEQGRSGGRRGDDQVVVGTIQDITERRRFEDQIQFMTNHDPLTGLPNRRFLRERLAQDIERARRHGRTAALLYFDLDRFKRVNDSFGHAVGDGLLKAVGQRLTRSIRGTDTAARLHARGLDPTVARLGGDEFMILLSEIADPQDAARVARRVVDAVSEPFQVKGTDVRITPSVGVTLYPADGEDVETLLRNADTAMVHAKRRGRNNFQFFTDEMNEAAVERFELETLLHGAIDRGELSLEYQPIVDLRSGRTCGAEALARWTRPDGTRIPPDVFITVAEEIGLISKIGEWVLRRACEDCREWRKRGHESVGVAVNVSAHQFEQRDLADLVRQVLAETEMDPGLLELELTERVLIEGTGAASEVLEDLRKLGVSVSIDDFGTGYSSLSYLRRLAADTLKVDRSFVSGLLDDEDSGSIVAAILAMANSLGMRVIAEGVEDPREVEYLVEHGCDAVQGYLFAKPMPASELEAMLGRQWDTRSKSGDLRLAG